jgi:hypothetical protein
MLTSNPSVYASVAVDESCGRGCWSYDGCNTDRTQG